MGKERNRVNPDRQRQRYNREFKLEAVRLLEPGQKPAAQLAPAQPGTAQTTVLNTHGPGEH